MAELSAGGRPGDADDEGISLFVLGTLLLRRRRLIIALIMAGIVLGLAIGLLTPRVYTSSSTFIPQGSDAETNSALAIAAGQFGVRLPTTNGGWGPPIYVELLKSRALLKPLALDTIVVGEQGSRRVLLLDLLGVTAPTMALRVERAVRELRKIVIPSEIKPLGAVKVTVTTKWPSVSLALAERVVRGVNLFNLNTRKSQAASERQFVDVQAAEAARALRESEDRLQGFLQSNRLSGSPELTFERDRIQREVSLRQQLYTALMQSREEARIREVRDIPVITVLEEPSLPLVADPWRLILKCVLGAFAGAALGLVLTLMFEGITSARGARTAAAQEFFDLVEAAKPRFLRRRVRLKSV